MTNVMLVSLNMIEKESQANNQDLNINKTKWYYPYQLYKQGKREEFYSWLRLNKISSLEY